MQVLKNIHLRTPNPVFDILATATLAWVGINILMGVMLIWFFFPEYQGRRCQYHEVRLGAKNA